MGYFSNFMELGKLFFGILHLASPINKGLREFGLRLLHQFEEETR